jgi:DNA-binding CsgD family transcriptional regulator
MSPRRKGIDKELILNMYNIQGLSTYQIAEKLNISQSTVRYHLKGVPLRNRSDAQKEYLKNHDHQRKGKHNGESKTKEEREQQEETGTSEEAGS